MVTAIPHPVVMTIQPLFWPLVRSRTTLATTPSPRRMRIIVPMASARSVCMPRQYSRVRHIIRAQRPVGFRIPDAEETGGTCDNRSMDAASTRRNRMQVRVYPSLMAHDRDDARFWAALPVEERVLQVWKLSEAQWRLRGEVPDESGLPRSVARVRRP